MKFFQKIFWETVLVESANDDLLPFLLTVPLQKLAYYSAEVLNLQKRL